MFNLKNTLYLLCLMLVLLSCSLGSPTASIPTGQPAAGPAEGTEPAAAATEAPGLATTAPTLPPAPTEPPTSTPNPTFPPTVLPSATQQLPTATLHAGSPPDEAQIPGLEAGQEISLTTIQMFDETSGWGIGGPAGASDHILKTNDGGQSWTDRTPPEPAPAKSELKPAAGFFQSPATAWVVYYAAEQPIAAAPVVWRTQDGGQTWQASQPLNTESLNEFFYVSDLLFSDLQTGWLLAHVGVGMSHDYVALFRTSDGGQTWQRLVDPYSDSGIHICQKTSLSFTDALNGWLTGSCGGVAPGIFLFRTTDGGTTWQPVDLPAPPDIPDPYNPNLWVACGSEAAFFFNAQAGKIAVECRRYDVDPIKTDWFLYTTADGGATWSGVKYPGGALVFIATDIGWALSKDIYQTRDGGKSWAKLNTVTWDGSFDFVSETNGWAIARSETESALVQTTTGGKKWAIIKPVVK